MKRKSSKHDTPDAGGWMHAADDLFLARFRGLPCEICGEGWSFYNGRKTRSAGHHLLSKELHRAFRYDPRNIICLCPKHHLGADLSPHSHDVGAQAAFYDWLRRNRPSMYAFILEYRHTKFNKEWCYREIYQELGGEIQSKTGNLKDMKPVRHKNNVVREIAEQVGEQALTVAERKIWDRIKED